MKNHRLSRAYLVLLLIVFYLPIAVAIVYSFNDSKLSTVFTGFSLRWYKTLFNDKAMFKALVNSVVLGVLSSVIAALIASAAALAFRKKLPFSRFFSGASMIPILIPDIILGMVLLAYFSLFDVTLGFGTLLIAHVSFCIPHCFLQISARTVSMDPAPAEAARVMGAGRIRAFFEITLPYLLPAVGSGMFISFAMSFDDVIISSFVTGVGFTTLPVKVYSQAKLGMTPEINALCSLMIILAVVCLSISGFIRRKTEK